MLRSASVPVPATNNWGSQVCAVAEAPDMAIRIASLLPSMYVGHTYGVDERPIFLAQRKYHQVMKRISWLDILEVPRFRLCHLGLLSIDLAWCVGTFIAGLSSRRRYVISDIFVFVCAIAFLSEHYRRRICFRT